MALLFGTVAPSTLGGDITIGELTDPVTDGAIIIGDGTSPPTELVAFTSSTGFLTHESGGLEFDASAVTTGDVIAGASAGVMAIVAASGASDGDVLTIQANGTALWETPGAGAAETLAVTLTAGNTTGASDIVVSDTQAVQTALLAGNTMLFQARDVDGAAYTTFITFTANNTPTCDLSTAVTIGSNTILDNTSTVSALTTVGILGSGSIASGFGNIDIGSSTLAATGTITGPSGTWDAGGMDIATGDSYAINSTDVLTATALGSLVVGSSLTSVGTITTGTWNGTDIAVPDGGTGRGTATAFAVLCGGTTSTAAHQSVAALGSSGDILTSNGAGALPTFQAAAAASVDVFHIMSTYWETGARITQTTVGGGSISFGTTGIQLTTSTTSTSSARGEITSGAFLSLTQGDDHKFSSHITHDTNGSDFDVFVGVGNLVAGGAGIIFTGEHYGFSSERAAAGAITYSATNANGTTRTSTSITNHSNQLIHAKKTGSTDITFFRAGALVATHTTNLPTSNFTRTADIIASNVSTTANTVIRCSYFTYEHIV